MNSSHCIEQKGVIKEIEKGLARVIITSYSSCTNCESKIACGMSESATKEIDVPVNKGSFSIGEQVVIMMKSSMGLKAVGFAYLIPFLLLITSLGILSSFHINELFTGLISIGILIPYFFLLYFFRKNLNKTFSFSLKKI